MIVRGVGPSPCPFMMIGPHPGHVEDRTGVPFTGKVGEELKRFLGHEGIPDRPDWYLTNLMKFFGGHDYVYSASDIEIANEELWRELRRVQPDLIVAMGREVARLMLGDVDVTDVESIPWKGLLCHGCGHITTPRSQRERLLALHGEAETGQLRSDQYLLRGQGSEGAHRLVPDVRRPDPSGKDSRSPLQSHVVLESDTHNAFNSSTQQRSGKTTTHTLPKRTSTGSVSLAQDTHQTSAGARYSESVLSGVLACSSTPQLDETQGQVQCCSTCRAEKLHDVVIFVLIHIAAGMRNPELSPYVVNGFAELARYFNGDVDARLMYDDPYPEPHYEEITTEARLDEITRNWQAGTRVGLDTEGWPGLPWSLQFSTDPGTGYLIRAGATELLRQFHRSAHSRRVRLVFHSALHDLGMMRALGIPWEGDFEDTMVAAYLLQLVPQGLKPGCLRYCNMRMSDYMDIMGDTANNLAREYLTWIWESEQTKHDTKREAEFVRLCTTPYTDARGKVKPGRKLRKWPEVPKSPLLKAAVRVVQSKRPYTLWLDQVDDLQVAAYSQLGPIPPATLDYVDPETAINYAGRDPDGTLRLLPEYERRIDAMELRSVYELELSTYPLIDRMHHIGIQPDLKQFADLSGILAYDIEHLRETLCVQTANPTFNANSGDQVADYVFGVLGLDEMKMTRGGRGSTNDKVLEALEREHPEYPVLSDIRQYREKYKLKNTFVDRIPDFVNRWPYDGRVHATFRTTRVVTGRLAASDPNLLAQPEHGKLAKEFQMGWVAGKGSHTDPEKPRVVCAWDQSQVELRGLAHLSQDPVLLAVYRGEARNPDGSPIDLHAKLAQKIFGGPIEQYMHKCLGRLAAKAINFGIPMGMTNRGLSVELRKNGVEADEDDAQKWLDDTLDLYKGVQEYMDWRIAEAHKFGYIRCLSGRIRYIGGINSRDDRIREEAERFAFSTPVQESAQWIMKQAEAAVWTEVLPYFWKQNLWVEPLLQVHDCLKMECEHGLEQDLHVLMSEAMCNVPQTFSVPLEVEGEYGPSFAETTGF